MYVLLSLAFLVAVIWLLGKARDKGWLNLGDCPCCSHGKRCSRHSTMSQHHKNDLGKKP